MHSSEHRRDFACWMTIKASELRIQITIEDKRIHWQIKFMTQGCAKTEHSHLGPCRFPPTMNRLKGAAVLPISTSHDTLIDHWVWRRRISFGSKFTGSKFRHLSISRRCVLVLYARRGSSRYVHSYLLSNCCTVDVRKKVTLHTTREAWQKELPSIFLLLSFSLGFALRQSPFLSLILCISDQTNHRFTTKLLWTRRGSSPATTWNNRRRYYPTLSSRFDTSRV